MRNAAEITEQREWIAAEFKKDKNSTNVTQFFIVFSDLTEVVHS